MPSKPSKQQLILQTVLPEVNDYLSPKYYWADKWNKVKWFFETNKKELGFLTVRKRSARIIAYKPNGEIDYENCIYSDDDWKFVIKLKGNLLTNGGRDFIIAQSLTNTSAGTRGAGFIAVSSNTVAPSASDTTLAGEITTGGLARADATTKTHTAGTNTAQFIHTFTATATHTDTQKAATFNASSAGTMLHENTYTVTTLNNTDQLELTWNYTYG